MTVKEGNPEDGDEKPEGPISPLQDACQTLVGEVYDKLIGKLKVIGRVYRIRLIYYCLYYSTHIQCTRIKFQKFYLITIQMLSSEINKEKQLFNAFPIQ